MTILVLIESVLLAVLTVLVAGLLRAYGAVLRRLHALDQGNPVGPRRFDLLPTPVVRQTTEPEFGPAHDIAGETLNGEIVSARVVDVEHDTLLLFLSSGCGTCATFWTELATPGAIHLPRTTRMLVVPQSAEDESLSDLADLAPDGIDVILSSAAWRDYEVPGSPHAVYVDGASGRVRGEGTGQSLAQIAELLARSTGDAGFLTGDAAPKSSRDREQELSVDRELLAAGILPGDARLYGSDE